MKRQMFITVGTSLFSSATWEAAKEILDVCPGYDHWTRAPAFLGSPELRRSRNSTSEKIRFSLETALRERLPGFWAPHLPEDFRAGEVRMGTAMRYCAELATLIKLAEQDDEGRKLRALLKSYEEVFVAFDADVARPTAVVGPHLVSYIKVASGADRVRPLPVPGLSSTDGDKLLQPNSGVMLLKKRIIELAKQPAIDLLVTGGYKVYALVLASLLFHLRARTCRLVYIHEEGDKLITIDPEHVGMDGEDYPFHASLDGGGT